MAQGTIWHGRAGRQRARNRCEVVPRSPDGQAAIAGPSRARAPSRREVVLTSARGRGCTAVLLGAEGSSRIGSSVSAVPGSSIIPPGSDGRSSKLSFSEGAPGERRPYACTLRNWVHVGSIRRGAGPSPPSRSTVAMLVAETSIPSFRSSPRILRYPHLGFSLPSRRIRCLNEGSSGGRPGGREPRPLLLLSRSRCHRASVSGPTRKLFHRLRDRARATAARNARSAVGEEDSPAASAEDLELVAEHDGLDIQLIEAAADQQAEQPAQKPVPDGPQHLGSLMPGRPACERPGRSGGSSFFTPQGPSAPVRMPTRTGR
jgi:hypothetical protein